MMTMHPFEGKKLSVKRAAVYVALAGLGGLAAAAGRTAWDWLLTLL
ncbi:hypothetical protein [Streptomyces hydrogenans]